MKKLLSRKFILSFASFIGSIGTSIAGLKCDNETVVIIGIICSMLSTAIYTASEAYIDASATTNRTISVSEYVSRETLGEKDASETKA